MAQCDVYTLAACVDNYFLDRLISKKKYYAAYMTMAKKEWQKLFRNTIWAVQSRWMTLKAGDPYNYVDVPMDASRLLSVSVEDNHSEHHNHRNCGLIQPLYYNEQINVIVKPKHRKCGCESADCGCDGVCEAVNSFAYTTKFIFSINGVDYYEQCWFKYCKNGDILEYCKTPTKVYNNIVGDGGDYNGDFNDDWLIGSPPFSDFTIKYVDSQKKICHLETEPCGCPKETPENAEILNNVCGCQLNFDCRLKRRHCREYFPNVNNNHLGEVKISECGTKIYFRPGRHCHGEHMPKFLLVSYQTNGLGITDEVLVPDYAMDAMEAGINWRSKRFNAALPQVEKENAFYQYEMEVSNLIAFLNPLSIVEIGKVQDEPVRW